MINGTSLLLLLGLGAVQNPVMPGDHPDPSVVRIGNDYWAANTSSEWAPIFALSTSGDLRHWTERTAVFTERPAWAIANFWAPELYSDGGKIRVYYAARERDGPLCVAVATADKPGGTYTDRGPLVCQKGGSIDPYFTHDEKGAPYLIWKEDGNSRNQPSIIFAQPTSADGLKLNGSPRELIRNDAPWEGKVVEGPDVMRHGDYFYLFYAGGSCCGTACNYGEGVARSKSLLGPWQKNPANPIVTSNADWRCPGHGTEVAGPDGAYLLYHAYPRRGFTSIGREAVLDRISWRDDWPVIDQGHGPAPATQSLPAPVHDDFRNAFLAPGWQWPLDAKPVIHTGAAGLTLVAAPAQAEDRPGAVLARSVEGVNYTAETTLDSSATQRGGGLAIVGDRKNAAGVALHGGRLIQWQINAGKWMELADAAAPAGAPVRLRLITHDSTQFQTWYASEKRVWTQLGKVIDVSTLPPWDRGLRVGLFADGTQGARFSSFDLRYSR